MSVSLLERLKPSKVTTRATELGHKEVKQSSAQLPRGRQLRRVAPEGPMQSPTVETKTPNPEPRTAETVFTRRPRRRRIANLAAAVTTVAALTACGHDGYPWPDEAGENRSIAEINEQFHPDTTPIPTAEPYHPETPFDEEVQKLFEDTETFVLSRRNDPGARPQDIQSENTINETTTTLLTSIYSGEKNYDNGRIEYRNYKVGSVYDNSDDDHVTGMEVSCNYGFYQHHPTYPVESYTLTRNSEGLELRTRRLIQVNDQITYEESTLHPNHQGESVEFDAAFSRIKELLEDAKNEDGNSPFRIENSQCV